MSAIALSALVIATHGLYPTNYDVQPEQPWNNRAKLVSPLSDEALGSIRGGQGLSFADTGGAGRIANDPLVRDTALAQSVAVQQMDVWWTDIGSVLIAANFQ